MKKTLSLLLSFVMVVSVIAEMEHFVFAATDGDFEYTVDAGNATYKAKTTAVTVTIKVK